uniref:EB domain-containing protein n=1 Tax=Elaeophora elaphi TaxID=1147741 RepID=A0A0R3RIP9_9BILA
MYPFKISSDSKVNKSEGENLQPKVLNRTDRKILLRMKQSPLRIINIALNSPLNIFIRNEEKCKQNRDCTDKEFCWNGCCFSRGDPCLTDDHCSAGLMCSKLSESKNGVCIFVKREDNIKNVTSQTNKSEITLASGGVIKTNGLKETKLETILTHKDESDIMNETAIEFTSNLIGEAMSLKEIIATDHPSAKIEINIFDGEVPTESSSLFISFPNTSNEKTTEVSSSPTTKITILSSPATETTVESMSPSSHVTENITESMSPSSFVTEMTSDDLSSMSSSSFATEVTTESTSPSSLATE